MNLKLSSPGSRPCPTVMNRWHAFSLIVEHWHNWGNWDNQEARCSRRNAGLVSGCWTVVLAPHSVRSSLMDYYVGRWWLPPCIYVWDRPCHWSSYFRYFLHDCRPLVTNVRITGNYSAESQVETQARYLQKIMLPWWKFDSITIGSSVFGNQLMTPSEENLA